MRSRKVTRYYCDHCSRGSFQKPAMARHEAACYRNANRSCHRCDGKTVKKPIAEREKPIKTMAGECPDCLMAAVVRYNMAFDDADPWEMRVWYEKEQYKEDGRHWDLVLRGVPTRIF
jgi:hypothetical protein